MAFIARNEHWWSFPLHAITHLAHCKLSNDLCHLRANKNTQIDFSDVNATRSLICVPALSLLLRRTYTVLMLAMIIDSNYTNQIVKFDGNCALPNDEQFASIGWFLLFLFTLQFISATFFFSCLHQIYLLAVIYVQHSLCVASICHINQPINGHTQWFTQHYVLIVAKFLCNTLCLAYWIPNGAKGYNLIDIFQTFIGQRNIFPFVWKVFRSQPYFLFSDFFSTEWLPNCLFRSFLIAFEEYFFSA